MNKSFTLITGACGGLGGAYIDECVKREENLVLAGLNSTRLEEIKNNLKASHPELDVHIFVCDQSKEEKREEFFAGLKKLEIKLRRVVLCAGYIDEGSFNSKTERVINDIVKVNCEGTLDFFKKAYAMRASGERFYCTVVSSLSAFYSMPQMAVYAASKSFLVSIFVALRNELKKENTYISTVCPAGMPTTSAMIASCKAQGFWGGLTTKSASSVARLSLKKTDKNKAIVVPGFVNKFIKFITIFLPRKTVAAYIGSRWRKVQKAIEKKDCSKKI